MGASSPRQINPAEPFVRRWMKAVGSEDGPSDQPVRLTLFALSLWMDQEGTCFPAQDAIALAAGMSERRLRRWLQAAEEQGWIQRERFGSKGSRGWSYRYRATFPSHVSDAAERGAAPSAPWAAQWREEVQQFRSAADQDRTPASGEKAAKAGQGRPIYRSQDRTGVSVQSVARPDTGVRSIGANTGQFEHQDRTLLTSRPDTGVRGKLQESSKKRSRGQQATESSESVRVESREGATAHARGIPLPDDWNPNAEHERVANSRRVFVHVEARKMRDWARSTGALRADWDAYFLYWLRSDRTKPDPEWHPPVKEDFI